MDILIDLKGFLFIRIYVRYDTVRMNRFGSIKPTYGYNQNCLGRPHDINNADLQIIRRCSSHIFNHMVRLKSNKILN